SDGAKSITAIVTDAVGNASDSSDATTITLDTAAPTIDTTDSITSSDTDSDGVKDDNLTVKFSEAVKVSDVRLSNISVNNSRTIGTEANGASVTTDGNPEEIVVTGLANGVNGTYSLVDPAVVANLTLTGSFTPAGGPGTNDIDTTKPVYSYTNEAGEIWYIWARVGSGYHISKLDSTGNWYWTNNDVTNPEDAISWFNSTADAPDPGSTDVSSSIGLEAYTTSYTITLGSDSTVTSADTLTVSNTEDAAGNSANVDFTVPDIVAPNVPTITSITDDEGGITGNVADNGRTDDTNLVVRVSLTGTEAVAGDTIQLYNDTTALGTTVVLTSTDISRGYKDITTSGLDNGTTYAVNAKVIDASGNESTASSNHTVTVDTTAPDAPTAISLDSDSGESSSDGVTNSGVVNVTLASTLSTNEA
ncbi:hypothetical protein, partial [Poseidonibacter ostreae]|uniref:hypothetical protein n=1 Tax=Poseidonibacter ostreae TaxID=2654171 RepID=UPI001D00310B